MGAGVSDYRVTFSHEFEAGPSGPARSYWKVTTPGGKDIGLLCLHRRGEGDPSLVASTVEHMLLTAHQAGEKAKAREIQKALGL
jgi:hypothetical protein